MIWLHGDTDCEILEEMPAAEASRLTASAIEVLRARHKNSAAKILEETKFSLHDSTNHWGDDFSVLYARVPLADYERLRNLANLPSGKATFGSIASVLSELGPYIRCIVCDLDQPVAPMEMETLAPDYLQGQDLVTIQAAWRKAQARRTTDPEGAITSARSLLETVCKHILDELQVGYADDAKLPKLYGAVATELKLAPKQHKEEVYKRILGGCVSVVEGLGSLRNTFGDAHGKGKHSPRPAPRHAELTINLAGSMALFLLATWQAQALLGK